LYNSIPPISGDQLIALLKLDGWASGRKTRHGISLTKYLEAEKRTLVTFVPSDNKPLPTGTLHDILGMKQTRVGSSGLIDLLNKFGIP